MNQDLDNPLGPCIEIIDQINTTQIPPRFATFPHIVGDGLLGAIGLHALDSSHVAAVAVLLIADADYGDTDYGEDYGLRDYGDSALIQTDYGGITVTVH